MIQTVGLDADDTLWENEHYFRRAQTGLAELLSEFGDPDEINAQLDRTERRNLARYGYGPKGFVLSMVQTAIDLTNGRVSAVVISRIIDLGHDMLAHPVDLIAGVTETLTALSGRRLLLITKGDLIDQERKIAASGLSDYFHAIEIVSDKTSDSYARLLQRHQIPVDGFIMAGNSVKSDILPVLAIGGHAALIPHDLTWQVEHDDDPEHARFHRLNNITGLPALLLRLGNGA